MIQLLHNFDRPVLQALWTTTLIVTLVFVLASLCPLVSLPGSCPLRPPHLSHICGPLFTRDHRLKPGRITVTWCPCVWCFAGTPLHSGNALGLFPTLVFRCGELGITTESSYHPKAFLTDSNHWPGFGFPQTMRICPRFKTAEAPGIKLWTTELFVAEQAGVWAPQ